MKFLLALVLVAVSAQAFAGQNWYCSGESNTGESVKAIFETRSNTVIAQVLVMREELIIARINSQVRRDAGYKPTTYKGFNRFDLNRGNATLNLLLPHNLARLDDEFSAYLQQGGGSSKADTVRLTCTGAG